MIKFRNRAIACALAVTLGALCHVQAGDFAGRNISVGAKAGVSLSRINFQPSVPQGMIQGFVMGATARYIEENHFGLIAEFNLEQRGWNEDFDPLEGYSYKRRLTYLQIPLLTHIYFGSEKARFFFNAGPEIGFMIGESTSSNFDHEHAAGIQEILDTYRQVAQFTLDIDRRFDYGISAGLGMEVNIGRKNALNLEGRFYYGLNDIFQNHKTDPFQGSSSMSVMITMGYNFRVK